jgi:hypothetical protein
MGKGAPVQQMTSKIEPDPALLIALTALLEIANSGKRLHRLRAIKVLMEYAARAAIRR